MYTSKEPIFRNSFENIFFFFFETLLPIRVLHRYYEQKRPGFINFDARQNAFFLHLNSPLARVFFFVASSRPARLRSENTRSGRTVYFQTFSRSIKADPSFELAAGLFVIPDISSLDRLAIAEISTPKYRCSAPVHT